MKNIKHHKICIPHEVIDQCWLIYDQKYKTVESGLFNNKISGLQYLHHTGAFQLNNKEIKKIKRDRLYGFFIDDKTNKISIKLKTKYVFRGLDYFVGIQSVDNQKKVEIICKQLAEMMSVLNDVTHLSNVVLYLALVDYIRNYLFMLLYALNQITRELENASEIEYSYGRLVELIVLMERIFINSWSSMTIYSISDLPDTESWLKEVYLYFKKSMVLIKSNPELYHNLFRKIRECNNPAKIVNFSKVIAEEYLPSNTVLIGVEYGGIEIPFIVNAYRSFLGKNELPFLTVNLSSYSTHSNKYVDRLDDSLAPFNNRVKLKDKNIMILDDSTTTGRTIERLVKLLPDGIENIFLGVMSFTNTNRYHHLTRLGHGGINPEVVKYSQCFYKSNFTQTYTKNSYTNKSGVFDKEKNSIIKTLGDYYPELHKYEK